MAQLMKGLFKAGVLQFRPGQVKLRRVQQGRESALCRNQRPAPEFGLMAAPLVAFESVPEIGVGGGSQFCDLQS